MKKLKAWWRQWRLLRQRHKIDAAVMVLWNEGIDLDLAMDLIEVSDRLWAEATNTAIAAGKPNAQPNDRQG